MEVAGVCTSPDEAYQLYCNYVDLTWDLYTTLPVPVRQLKVGCKELQVSEAARTDFQVWLPAQQSFVTIGNVGLRNEYVSRRLCIYWNSPSNKLHYANTIHGSVIDVSVLLAALMENFQTQDMGYNIPSDFTSQVFS